MNENNIGKPKSNELILSPELEFKKEKFINDLRKGFKIKIEYPENTSSTVKVVTRAGEDLFEVETSTRHRPALSEYEKELLIIEGKIRRKKAIPNLETGERGTGTLEIFQIRDTSGFWHSEKDKDQISSFRIQVQKGGKLDEKEFFKRYNSSLPDLKLTEELFKFDKAGTQKFYQNHEDIDLTFEEKLNNSEMDEIGRNPKNPTSNK